MLDAKGQTESARPPTPKEGVAAVSVAQETTESNPPLEKAPGALCEGCTLRDEAFVPSSGPKQADLVIVGEAPGFNEVRQGIPFIGKSGDLLNTVLKHHNIDRNKVHFTNTVLCRPPENRDPTKKEVACCAPRLRQEIREAKPVTVLALGGTAASAVVGTHVKITSFRAGPAKESPFFDGVRIIPTVHPAACFRMPDLFPSLVADIGKINAETVEHSSVSGGNSVGRESPAYRAFDEAALAQQALRELLSKREDRPLTIDIETAYEKDTSFDHPSRTSLLCIGIGYDRGRVAIFGNPALQDNGVRHLLSRLLSTRRIVAHNGKFDLAGLRGHLGEKVGTLYADTMLQSYVLDERSGTHGLKYLAGEVLGLEDYTSEIKKYKNWSDIPRDDLYKYNAFDVACTYELHERFSREIGESGLGKWSDFLTRASNNLLEIESRGVSVDSDYLSLLGADYSASLSDLELELNEWVDNPRSPKQVKESIEEFGLTVESTDVEHLEYFLSKSRNKQLTQFLTLMLRYRKEHKTYATYIEGIRKRLYKGRVFPTYLLHGTVTGRLSCRNPNLQNITRGSELRSLFVPSPGNVFVQADFSQAELRVVATLARDEYLRGVFTDTERDIHSEVATRFFGPNFSKEQRVKAKSVVFGTTYGMEAVTLSAHMNISQKEAVKYLDDWFSMIPGVVKWKEEIRQRVLHDHEDLIAPPFGRHRRFWLITNDNKKDVVKEATAFYPQAVASDICLASLCELTEAGFDTRLTVHDSILIESPVEEAEGTAQTMKQTMENAAAKYFDDYIPFKVDISIGDSWGVL